MGVKDNKETQFKKEIHKLNHWMLYCKENIKRGRCDMSIDWGIELAQTQARKREAISNHIKDVY